jgi:probable rRNA maturation factor
MCCKVLVINKQKEIRFVVYADSIQNAVETVLSCEQEPADFVTIEFLSDAKTRQMHKKFFGDPASTDCMSFPIDLENSTSPRHLGDIFICPKTALIQAENNPDVFFEELTLYLVHGLLHLLGYDDCSAQEKRTMRQRERRIMKCLRDHGQILSGKLKL